MKRLIIHADDLGLAHSINKATFAALKDGTATSASVMVPCPWFAEAADFARHNPEIDVGIHLTLTGEWPEYRWGPVAPRESVSSLLDPSGYFFSDLASLGRQAQLDQVEHEIRAQIELAIDSGITPTHLDSHMFALFARPVAHSLLRRVGREYGLNTPVPGGNAYREEKTGIDLPLDRMYQVFPETPPDRWTAEYTHIIESLPNGISILLVHLGEDNDELRLITRGVWPWGAKWRALDNYSLRTETFRETLRRQNIQLCTWADLARAEA
jgi:chitin disaccharide deacetylase